MVSLEGLTLVTAECFQDAKWQGIIKTMSDGLQRDLSCGWVGEERNNVPSQPKQSNNARDKMFGNTPVFSYRENAALHTGLVLPGDLKWFRNYPTTSVFRAAHLHRISEICVLTRIYLIAVDRAGALAGAAQQLDMDIFNIITGEPVERWKNVPYRMLPCM